MTKIEKKNFAALVLPGYGSLILAKSEGFVPIEVKAAEGDCLRFYYSN